MIIIIESYMEHDPTHRKKNHDPFCWKSSNRSNRSNTDPILFAQIPRLPTSFNLFCACPVIMWFFYFFRMEEEIEVMTTFTKHNMHGWLAIARPNTSTLPWELLLVVQLMTVLPGVASASLDSCLGLPREDTKTSRSHEWCSPRSKWGLRPLAKVVRAQNGWSVCPWRWKIKWVRFLKMTRTLQYSHTHLILLTDGTAPIMRKVRNGGLALNLWPRNKGEQWVL